jgi:hypothetical protein
MMLLLLERRRQQQQTICDSRVRGTLEELAKVNQAARSSNHLLTRITIPSYSRRIHEQKKKKKKIILPEKKKKKKKTSIQISKQSRKGNNTNLQKQKLAQFVQGGFCFSPM